MKSLFIFILLSVMLGAHPAFTQDFNRARMDSFFDQLAEKKQAMGSFAISKNGTVLYSRAIGFTNISESGTTAATTTTKYRIGSITKTFTATMILQLVQEGKLSLEDRLAKFFPTIPNATTVTIRQLLSHRSGIHNFTNDSLYSTYYLHPKSREAMLSMMAANPPDFAPGEKATYSNANYVLLGYLVEIIDKGSYAQSLAKRIVSKAALSNTMVGGKISSANRESHSYIKGESWLLAPETEMSIPGGAGSIISTPTDLVKFYEALFGLQLINAALLEEMKTLKDGFGLGLTQVPFHDRKAFAHNGRIDGFVSSVGHFPSDSMTFAYCSNGQVYPFNNVLVGVLSIYFNTPNYKLPGFEKVMVPAQVLDQYLGIYATTQIPLKLTVTRTGEQLFAQGTGQPKFPLDAVTQTLFKFDQANLQVEFNATTSELTLKQGGATILFVRE